MTAVSFACAAAFGCAASAGSVSAPPPARLDTLDSGFLSDYKRLQPTEQSPSVLMFRDAGVKKGYRKLLFRPIQVWRGADQRLEDIPDTDLQYLADSFYRAMVTPLGHSFELVEKPGPGVLEIQVALTLVTKPHQPIDFFSTAVPVRDLHERTQQMSDGTKLFVHDCALEVELSEAGPASATHAAGKPARPKRIVKAEFFDKRRGSESPKAAVQSWTDLDAVFAKWATTFDSQLVALKDGTFKPRFTVATKPAAKTH